MEADRAPGERRTSWTKDGWLPMTAWTVGQSVSIETPGSTEQQTAGAGNGGI